MQITEVLTRKQMDDLEELELLQQQEYLNRRVDERLRHARQQDADAQAAAVEQEKDTRAKINGAFLLTFIGVAILIALALDGTAQWIPALIGCMAIVAIGAFKIGNLTKELPDAGE